MQSCLDSDDKGFYMFLVTIYLNMSSVNNYTPNEPPGETSTTSYFFGVLALNKINNV